MGIFVGVSEAGDKLQVWFEGAGTDFLFLVEIRPLRVSQRNLALVTIFPCPSPTEVDFCQPDAILCVVQPVTHTKKSNGRTLAYFSTLQYSTRNPKNGEMKRKLPEITVMEFL